MIDFENTEITENTFINYGDLVDPVLINEKINPILNRNVDLRKTSEDVRLYINIGDYVTVEEINNAYNN